SGNLYTMKGSVTNVSDRVYFQEAINGKNSVSDPIINKVDGSIIIVFAVPLKNEKNEIIGILAAQRDGNQLSKEIEDVTYAKTGYAFIIDSDGYKIAHINKELVFNSDNDFENVKTDPELAQLVELEKQMASGKNGVGQYNYNGITKYMGYYPVLGTDWSLGLTAPDFEIFEAINQMALIIVISCVIFLVICIFAAVLIASSIANPISITVGEAGKIAKGDFTIEIPEQFIGRKDEIGKLAGAFKFMVDNLNEVMFNINTASEQVASGSQQVSDSSMALSQGATEQASSIEELTASIEEISSQTKQNAVNAKEASKLAMNTKTAAEKGNSSMKEMLNSMDAINNSSNNISKIIKVIDDIAI
ncbi:MAG: methyl-accepting chemotaxis protein, partial [Clostridia bacterium]|nr:methyl-accepting chemotaxis protein [Clostridia bacterium]